MYNIRKAREEDFPKIKFLQKENHFRSVSNKGRKKEGFVSVETSISMLENLNQKIGILVAVSKGEVVGYELPLDLKHASKISLLDPFIERILKLEYLGKKLSEYKIILEGQILVKMGFKGQGIAEELHKRFVNMLKNNYEIIVTEISNKNPRSLHFHTKKLKLSIIEKYFAKGFNWYILLQDIREK